jgi:hypothetical protein
VEIDMGRWAWLLVTFLPAAALAAKPDHGPARLDLRFDWGIQTNAMGDWHDGIADLELRATARGLDVLTSSNPGVGSHLFGSALIRVTRSTWVGGSFGRVTSRPRFTVLEVIGFPAPGYGSFLTEVDAYSLVTALVVKQDLNAGRFHPFAEVAVGSGSGQVNFDSPGARVHGDGRAPIVMMQFGLEAGIAHFAIGGEYHRYDVTYREFSFFDPGPTPPARFWFESEDELRFFTDSRSVDQSGLFVRLGLDLRMFHESSTTR